MRLFPLEIVHIETQKYLANTYVVYRMGGGRGECTMPGLARAQRKYTITVYLTGLDRAVVVLRNHLRILCVLSVYSTHRSPPYVGDP
jgi:hypothetical protein